MFMGIAFVGFSLARLLTGRDFMIRTRKGWIILALLTNASLVVVFLIGKLMGLEDSLLPYGIWPYVAAFVLVGLLTWGSYRASRRHLDNGEDV
jgi:ABC-type Fe3+ transport system permease subunit